MKTNKPRVRITGVRKRRMYDSVNASLELYVPVFDDTQDNIQKSVASPSLMRASIVKLPESSRDSIKEDSEIVLKAYSRRNDDSTR
jgi:hypothetical protein